MSYLVLARKFRPQSFGAIRGQEYITKAISNAIIRDRVPHAFLFCGPRGVGKTSTARVLAKALNCTGREIPAEAELEKNPELWKNMEPCGECANCLEITRSASLAVWEIDGASNNSVDNVRELIDSLRSSPPPGSKYKIYIIDEVHMLSTAAFNALLKSLEEPPPNTIFIFATTEPQKIPETVISRCQRHDFRRLGLESIEDQLKEIAEVEGVQIDSEVLTFIARKAQGGMRDAQSMLDRLLSFSFKEVSLAEARKVFGVLDSEFFLSLSEVILAKNADACFELIDKAFSESINLRYFVDDFLTHWRNLLIISSVKDKSEGLRKMLELSEDEFKSHVSLVSGTESFDIQRLFDYAQELADSALRSNYPRYVFEAGLAKMASLSSLKPIPEILEILKSGKTSDLQIETSRNVEKLRPSVLAKEVASEKKKTIVTKGPSEKESQQSAADQDHPEFVEGVPVAATTESAEKESKESTFNPSWEDFIHHVQGRSEVVLAAFLRRVSPKNFREGLLEIAASPFDLKSLRDSDTRNKLINCLYSYSGSESWTLNIAEQEEGESKGSSHGPAADSLIAQERSRILQKKAYLEEEARNQEATKSVMTVFEGATIEKISTVNSAK